MSLILPAFGDGGDRVDFLLMLWIHHTQQTASSECPRSDALIAIVISGQDIVSHVLDSCSYTSSIDTWP